MDDVCLVGLIRAIVKYKKGAIHIAPFLYIVEFG
jgi:hypothetical protein